MGELWQASQAVNKPIKRQQPPPRAAIKRAVRKVMWRSGKQWLCLERALACGISLHLPFTDRDRHDFLGIVHSDFIVILAGRMFVERRYISLCV